MVLLRLGRKAINKKGGKDEREAVGLCVSVCGVVCVSFVYSSVVCIPKNREKR